MPADILVYKAAPNYGLLNQVKEYEYRVGSNGGTVTKSELAVYNAWVKTLLDAGIYDNVYSYYSFTPSNFLAGMTPFKIGGGKSLLTNAGGVNFTAADYSTRGLQGKTNACLDAGFTAKNLWGRYNSGGVGVYYNTNDASGQNYCGILDGTTTLRFLRCVTDDNSHDGMMCHDGTSPVTYTSSITEPTYFFGTRVSLSSIRVLANGVAKGSETTTRTVTLRDDYTMYIMACNNSGALLGATTNRVQSFIFTSGLSDANVAIIYGAEQVMQTSWGRNN